MAAEDRILSIWDRVFQPDGPMPPEVARYLLRLGPTDRDQDRVDVLSAKVQELPGLTADERAELETHIQAAGVLSILQSRARVALRTDTAAAGGVAACFGSAPPLRFGEGGGGRG